MLCFACGGIGQRAARSAELLTQHRLGRLGWEDCVPSVWLVEGLNLGRKAKMHHKQKMLSGANRGSSCLLLTFLSSGTRVVPQ